MCESAQVVPLVTDALAAGVDRGSIVVVELTADRETSLTAEYLIDLIFIQLCMSRSAKIVLLLSD